MKSEEALESMRDIESHLACFNNQLDISIMNGWEGQKSVAIKDISKFKQRAKKIYEKFEDGCRELFQQKGETDYDSCGIYQWFCPNCKEIKMIHDAILGVRE